MSKRLENLKSLILGMVVIGFVLILTSCNPIPGEWEKEEIVTDYGDRFEHLFRLWPGGFPDPDYEHRVLFEGKEVLTYHEDDKEIEIHYIYNDKIIVYDIHGELIYRESKESVFQLLPIDSRKKEFYPVYYQMLLRGDVHTTKMLLSVGDKYAQRIVLAFASGDFSEAEKNDIYLEPQAVKSEMEYYSYLVEEYHLSK